MGLAFGRPAGSCEAAGEGFRAGSGEASSEAEQEGNLKLPPQKLVPGTQYPRLELFDMLMSGEEPGSGAGDEL